MAERVTVLPNAGRGEMYRRMLYGTNPRTGEPKPAPKTRKGRRFMRIRKSKAGRVVRIVT